MAHNTTLRRPSSTAQTAAAALVLLCCAGVAQGRPVPGRALLGCSNVIAAWGQCGGGSQDWSSSCCTDGYECVTQSEWYSQCKPAGAEPTPTDDKPPATPAPEEQQAYQDAEGGSCSNVIAAWGQCGGGSQDWSSSCCANGFNCVTQSEWYSQCKPAEDVPTPADEPQTTPAPEEEEEETSVPEPTSDDGSSPNPNLTFPASLFSGEQAGDGTYYGEIDPANGNCAIGNPAGLNAFNVDTMLAINTAQYQGSLTCGMCLEYWGTGTGSGSDPIPTQPRTAIVVDRCPGCAQGDLDLALSGDGRWGVQWRAIPCPVAGQPMQYAFEGSNAWFLKLQVRNHLVPIASVELLSGGDYQELQRTDDNHWDTSAGGFETPFPEALELRLTSAFGEVITDTITASPSTNTQSNPVNGGAQFTQSS